MSHIMLLLLHGRQPAYLDDFCKNYLQFPASVCRLLCS